MAAPNILGLTTGTGKTTYYTPANTSTLVLLPNAAASGQVYKINQLLATNISGSAAANTSVSIYTNGAVAQGSVPSGGTAYAIASAISVPAQAALIVIDSSTGLYLEEGTSITIQSGTANAITYSVSYEILT
jgi:hypothetical protein